MKKDENMDWEKEASHLASLARITPYRVPENYFDDLQVRINQAVCIDGLIQKEQQGFTVPQNYFENLSEQIESRIAVAEIKLLAKADGFKAPENYFEQLHAKILSKTSEAAPKTKTIRLWSSDLVKYAAVACFVIVAAAGLYVNQKTLAPVAITADMANEQMLYDIDESVIIEHIQETENMSTSLASDTEIEKYILENYTSRDLTNNL